MISCMGNLSSKIDPIGPKIIPFFVLLSKGKVELE